ncbi:hypothetical protein M0804_001328 [Polistes exclamans]|nr:hypothetical protein M0804_001328 [Polistes exclamans]
MENIQHLVVWSLTSSSWFLSLVMKESRYLNCITWLTLWLFTANLYRLGFLEMDEEIRGGCGGGDGGGYGEGRNLGCNQDRIDVGGI